MGCGRGSNSSSSLSFKTLLGTLIVLGFILVMLVGTLQSEGSKTKKSKLTTPGKLQQQEEPVKKALAGRAKSRVVHPQDDLNYINKRKVPHGPDPIHNRNCYGEKGADGSVTKNGKLVSYYKICSSKASNKEIY